MKKIFRIALLAVAAGSLFVACKDKDEPTEAISLSLVSIDADAYFTDGSADITATLSQALDKQVTVTLGPGYTTTASKYTIIDAEDVSYPTIVIPAGATEATASVTVDTKEYTTGRYQAQVCIASVEGANVYESKSAVNISLINGQPLASIEFDKNSFDDEGNGKIVLSLQNALDEESTVTIEYLDLSSMGVDVIPEDAIDFESEITIPADKDEVSIPVEVDLNKLTVSGDLAAGFVISKVSGNLDFDDEDFTYGFLTFTLPVAQDAWTAEYCDVWTSTRSGDTFDKVSVAGMDADQYYICARFPKGTYDNDAYISPVLAGVKLPGLNYTAAVYVYNGYTMAKLAYYGLVNQGPGSWDFDHGSAGEYDVYIIGLDAETGEFTGDYSVSTVEFADVSSFMQWSGDWKIGDDVTVSMIPYSLDYERVLISGIEGADYYVVADFDPETGNISITGQQVGSNQYIFPNIVYGGSLDFVISFDNITTISMTGEGEASASAESVDDGSGTLFMGAGMSVYDISTWEALSYIELPATLVKVEDDTTGKAVAVKDGDKLTPRERKPVIKKEITPITR